MTVFNAVALLVLIIVLGLVVLGAFPGGPKWLRWIRSPRRENETAQVVETPVARIVTVKEFRSVTYFFWFMFVIGTGLNTILTYASAETVLQEIAGSLLSIGNILFWGICIIVFTIEEKQTLYVYSETLTKLVDQEERPARIDA